MVIHDSRSHDQETQTNLTLLDMAAGHFSRIEYASGGFLPGSLISEFAHIAREYVNGKLRPASGADNQQSSARDLLSPETTFKAAPQQFPPTALTETSQAEMKSADVRLRSPRLHVIISHPTQQTIPTAIEGMGLNALVPSVPLDATGCEQNMQPVEDYGMGTDVMDLFNYFLPDLDPMFYEGLAHLEDGSFGQ